MECLNPMGIPLREKSISSQNINDDSDSIYSNDKKTGRWTKKEDDMLREVVPLYGEKQWRKISMHMQGRTAIQCLHRWTKILKPGLVKGPWTREEDQKLIEWVRAEGPTKWAQASLVIEGRSGKQCRERWFNNLSPQVKKGNWTVEEDDIIFKLYMQNGSSWSKIAKHIPGRTENSIKNRFYSTVRKIAADRKKGMEDPITLLDSCETQSQREELLNMVNENKNASSVNDTESVLNNSNDKSKSVCGEKLGLNGNTLYKLLQEKSEDLLATAVKTAAPKESSETTRAKKERKYMKKNKKMTEKQHQANNLRGPRGPGLFNEINGSMGATTSIFEDEEEEETEENQSEDQFETLLNSIESTINKELATKNLKDYKNMNLDELQNKVFEFCNNNIFDVKDDIGVATAFQPGPQLDIQAFLHPDSSMNPHSMESAEEDLLNIFNNRFEPPMKYTNPLMDNQYKMESIKQEEEKDDKKMVFLLQQLHVLEHMLTSTRTELMKLESSINTEPSFMISPVYNMHEYNHHMMPKQSDIYEPYQYDGSTLVNDMGLHSKRKISFEEFPGFEMLKKTKIESFFD